jgi:hypothetical protein
MRDLLAQLDLPITVGILFEMNTLESLFATRRAFPYKEPRRWKDREGEPESWVGV